MASCQFSISEQRRIIKHKTTGRKKTAIACYHCWQAKTGCSIIRPCARCYKKQLNCYDRPSKTRKRQHTEIQPKSKLTSTPKEIQPKSELLTLGQIINSHSVNDSMFNHSMGPFVNDDMFTPSMGPFVNDDMFTPSLGPFVDDDMLIPSLDLSIFGPPPRILYHFKQNNDTSTKPRILYHFKY
jgi:hypothetical protein